MVKAENCWTSFFCDNKTIDILKDKKSSMNDLKIKYDTFFEKNGEIILAIIVIAVIIFVSWTGGDGDSAGRSVNNILLPLIKTVAVVAVPIAKAGAKIAPNILKNKDKILKITKTIGKKVVQNSSKIARFIKPNFSSMIKTVPNKIGVYVVRKNGKVMYVGRAIEQRAGQTTSGLRKRLLEHFRGSRSGKKELFQNRDKVNIQTIALKSVDEVKKMEAKLIRKYDTVNHGWNKRNEMLKVVK